MAKYDATRCFLRTGVLMLTLFYVVRSDETCDIEIENTLKALLTPQEYPTIQLQSLRKNMLRRFQEALDKADEEDETNYKRSFSSLAQWNNLPETKRNLEALARAGYVRTLPNEETDDDDDPNSKRSIANLAKNGQLPTNTDSKRGIESLARNGELRHRKDIQELLDELYNKRNIGSLARNFNFPSSQYGKRFVGSLARSGDLLHYNGKRNVAALARDGTRIGGKRNVAALLRQDNYMNDQLSGEGRTEIPQASGEGKRNIASIKAMYSGKYKRSTDGVRTRRQADYYDGETEEFSAPVYQNQNVYDYEEMMRELTGVYPNTEKRFLGLVAKTGWFRPSSSRLVHYRKPEKRHIGALARLGWLPSFRSVRRFNRSGRSTEGDCRETSSDGETEDDSFSENSVSLEGKRFLLQPAVDNILLRKIYMHPKTHHPLVTNMS